MVLTDILDVDHEKNQRWMTPGFMLSTWKTGRNGFIDTKVKKTVRLSL